MRISWVPLSVVIFCLSLALIQGKPETNVNPTRVKEITAMLSEGPKGFGPPIGNRAAWEKLANEKSSVSIISHATALASQPVPAVSDEGFLDYSRTGNRDRYQKILFARTDRLAALALAECLENKGRFIGAITNCIESFCLERTWVYPAHDGKLNN